MVRAWSEAPQVREIQILSNQESRFHLRDFPDLRVRTAQEGFAMQGMNVVSQIIEEGLQADKEDSRPA